MNHVELTAWAKGNDMDNRAAFSNFKKALLKIGIDYDALRSTAKEAKTAELASRITHSITLYSDAKASTGRFAVVYNKDNPLWVGTFFSQDNAGEQSRAELAAAKKAVWFAGKLREELELPVMRLKLYVDAEWLLHFDSEKTKAYPLFLAAKAAKMVLDVRWIAGKDNPADRYTLKGAGFYSPKESLLYAAEDYVTRYNPDTPIMEQLLETVGLRIVGTDTDVEKAYSRAVAEGEINRFALQSEKRNQILYRA